MLVWTGMVAGISFLEAPIKFTAPQVTLAIGLGIGRLVFGWLNKCEIFFCAVMLTGLFFNRATMRVWVPALVVSMILFLQTTWLLPALDIRALQIIAGQIPAPNNLHFIYIALDLIKLVMLLGTAVTVYKQQISHHPTMADLYLDKA